MSTLTPGGVQGPNPDTQPRRHGGRSRDSSPGDMPDPVPVAEEDTWGDEQGYPPYQWRKGDNDMLRNGRERLTRHRREVAGRVWIPELWGQEELLKDWVDCTVFDSSLVPSKIMSAKAALMEGRRASSPAIPIEDRC